MIMSNNSECSMNVSDAEQLFQQFYEKGEQLHCLIVYQNGQEKIRVAAAPYTCEDKREVYSLSKSFTSVAIGILYDKGMLHLSDDVLSFFPEYSDLCIADTRWSRMQVRHLLSMSTGHEKCVFSAVAFSDNGVKAFFEPTLSYEPGERFVYNTGASYLLAAIVERISGMTVPTLLAKTVFSVLGIRDFSWKTCADGNCQGGAGLAISCDDVAKFGLMLLNRGVYNGQRVLSEEWITMATSYQIATPEAGDWCAGYGYHFWRNNDKSYRADGAWGQACIVLPERNMVVAILAERSESEDSKSLADRVREFLNSLEDKTITSRFTFQYRPQSGQYPKEIDTGWRDIEDNPVDILALRMQATAKGVVFSLLTRTGVQSITAPFARWQDNTIYAKNLLPTLHDMIPRTVPQRLWFSAASHQESESWVIEIRMRNAPHAFSVRLSLDRERLTARLESKSDVFGEERMLIEKQ